MTQITMNDETAKVFQAALNTFLKYGEMARSTDPNTTPWQTLLESCRDVRKEITGLDPNGVTECEMPNVLIGLMATSCMAMAVVAMDAQENAETP